MRGTLLVSSLTHDPRHTHIALFLMGELVASRRANIHETYKEWLFGGIKAMWRPDVEELIFGRMNPLLNAHELDRIVAWYLGVSL